VLLALTDTQTPNRYATLAEAGLPIAAGASTKHLLDYAAGLMGVARIDREQRDYAILPLRESGLVLPAYVYPRGKGPDGALIHHGSHLVSKSANSCYVLSADARGLLQVRPTEWPERLEQWLQGAPDRRRRAHQEAAGVRVAEGGHPGLIRTCVESLRAERLADFEIVYIDDADGDRVSAARFPRLAELGLELGLEDRYPDAILARENDRSLWLVDAVVSDGEVDPVREREITAWARRRGWAVAGFTTAYSSYASFARRQARMKNLAPGTSVWIGEDAGRLFRIEGLIR
jgi:hypothetical protein